MMTSSRAQAAFASWSRALLFSVVAVGGAGACSLINTFADLKPQGSDAGGDATTGDSGSAESGPGDASSEASEGGGGPDANFPDKGVIVVSGRVADDAGNLTGILTALAPDTGMELPNARQLLNAPVVLYDGKRDYWFVIETNGSSLFPTPTDHAVLHTRTLDPTTGTWTTLQSLQVPPPVFGLAGVLTNRIIYVGFDNQVDAQSGTSLITIDTGDVSAPNIYNATPLPVQPTGLIATRSTSGNGGPVSLLLAIPCPSDGGAPTPVPVDAGDDGGGDDGGDGGDDGGGSDAAGGIGGGECLAVQHVTVPTDPDPAKLQTVFQRGPFFGRAAYGSYLNSGAPEDVIAWSLPGANPGAPGATAINFYTPQNEALVGSPISIQTSDGFFQPFAFAECQQQALLTATNEDLSVYAIPLGAASGVVARVATTHSGQSVYFEPYTSTVLSPFTQGDGFVLTAFTLGGDMTHPTLTPRPNWNPPADLRPEVVAVRAPVTSAGGAKCPP